MISTVLIGLAFLCFVLDAFGTPTRLKLTPLGLACYMAAVFLVGR